jgi:radical SAM superfamily enzyme YgiQ (UPF0313 family)
MITQKKTSILFIHPPFPVNHRHKLVLPLSICRIAAYLEERNKNVSISCFDAHLNNCGKPEILDEVTFQKPDIVAIGYWTCQAPFVYELSKEIKKNNKDIFIIHGGIHASFNSAEVLYYCDVVVIGEGEKTFSELVKTIQDKTTLKNVKGIAFKEKDQVIKTPDQPLIDNLDNIPLPKLELIEMRRYVNSEKLRQLHVIGGKRIPILASRGCPYDCSFCLSPKMWRRKVRWRSPEKVVEEIKTLNQKCGFTRFQFYDDNFLLNPTFVNKLSSLLMLLDFDIQWVALSRAAHVIENKELLLKIKQAGCVGIEMGLETVDNIILEKINKNQKIDIIDTAVKLQREAGLSPLYTIMVFNPGETIDSIRKLREYVEENIPESINYKFFGSVPYVTLGQFATPAPGTSFFENRFKEGMVLMDDWSDLFHHQINFLPFSLLDDIPLAVEDFSETSIKQCVEISQISLFKYFPGDETIDQKNSDEMRTVSKKYYSMADGTRTIRAIANIISEETKIDLTKTLRFAAMTTIVLAQNKTIVSKK